MKKKHITQCLLDCDNHVKLDSECSEEKLLFFFFFLLVSQNVQIGPKVW